MRIALYQPDIPQNTGTLLRLCACTGVGLDIIEPCGFLLDDKKLLRAGMDYADLAEKTRHANWQVFCDAYPGARKILMTTRTGQSYTEFTFLPDDILIAGAESSGVPDDIHDAVDAKICIPMQENARSLNVALATAMILGEALRQVARFS